MQEDPNEFGATWRRGSASIRVGPRIAATPVLGSPPRRDLAGGVLCRECWPAPSGFPCCRNAGMHGSTSQAIRVRVCTGPGYHDQGEGAAESERVLTVDTSFRATAVPARSPECEGAGLVGAHPHS